MEARDWEYIEHSLKQRIHALNLFLDDIYHEQKILKDKAIPEIIVSATSFRPQCVGLDVRAASGAASPVPTWFGTTMAGISC